MQSKLHSPNLRNLTMKLNIKALLDFFDGKEDNQKGDATAMSSLLGEDLNAAVFKHFKQGKIEILEESVLPGTMKGKRLDRWLADSKNKILYQCEIKNWAASAIGGKQLKTSANKEEVRSIAQYHWDRQMKESFNARAPYPNGTNKVLLKMRRPKGLEELVIEPLLIYWMPIANTQELDPATSISTTNLQFKTEFTKLNIFSVSLYLRELRMRGKDTIHLDMPHFEHRMKILSKLQTIAGI